MRNVTTVAVAILLLVCPLSEAVATADTIDYVGSAISPSGTALDGEHRLEIRYLTPGDSAKPLAVESHSVVEFERGRFELTLGNGVFAYESTTLSSILEVNPEVQLEVVIDGQLQTPRVRILAGGHSPQSRAVLAGRHQSGPHWKDYDQPSSGTAVQAVQLRPAGAGTSQVLTGSLVHQSNPFQLPMDFLGESQAVRELPLVETRSAPKTEGREVNPMRQEDLFDAEGYRFGTRTHKVVDSLALESGRGAGPASPPPIFGFDGLDNISGVIPPDIEGTVGMDHYIQVVNSNFAIYDKSGSGVPVHGPVATNSLWSGFGGRCQSQNDGDAIFLYDNLADRYVLTQFAVSGSPDAVCFAVSTTNDPLGTYFLYSLSPQRMPDYYKLGVWPDTDNDAYFMGTNSGFQGQYDIYAIDRASLLAGTAPRAAQYFQSYLNLMMPADLDGSDLPPSGSPGLFYTFRDGGESYFSNPPTDSLDVYAFDVDWATPAASTVNLIASFVPPDFADFNWTICGFFESDCLTQPGTSFRIDSASWWPMQRLQYRNFGDHESLLGTWTVEVTPGSGHAAPRWFELRRSGGGSWEVYQQGSHAPDAADRWMQSISMDGSGNIALGYSVVDSAAALVPSIRYATRAPGDTLGELRSEQTLKAGGGVQENPFFRWGDYSSIELDPSDDCTFWYTNEYWPVTNDWDWATWIGTFKMPGCGALSTAATSQEVCAATGEAVFELTVAGIFEGTTNLSAAVCPVGGLCSFSPNPVVNPVTASTLTVDIGGVSAGAHTMTVSAVDSLDSGINSSLDLDLLIVAGVAAPPVQTSPANGAVEVSVAPSFAWQAVGGAYSYDLEVATDAGFSNVVASGSAIVATSWSGTSLDITTLYYWRVRASNVCGLGAWSSPSPFTTSAIACATYSSADVPVALLDNGMSSSTLNIGSAMVISDVDVHIVIDHTWVSELELTLRDPLGNEVTLLDRPGVPASAFGCADDDFDILFDDDSATDLENHCAGTTPWYSGVGAPTGALSNLAGDRPAGLWTLTVQDHLAGYTGTLQEWSLELCKESILTPASLFADGFEGGTSDIWSAVVTN